jgi:hypothetical protein
VIDLSMAALTAPRWCKEDIPQTVPDAIRELDLLAAAFGGTGAGVSRDTKLRVRVPARRKHRCGSAAPIWRSASTAKEVGS